ncbi:MAG: ABC transporter substrate-binding protein [Hyphomicrobiales bacterium]
MGRPEREEVTMSLSSNRRRLALACMAVVCLNLAGIAQGQAQVEVTYATFLDPNNHNDPRAAAQSKMIEAFEKANPMIKIKVMVDGTQQASFRALRARSAIPDVMRHSNYYMLEAANTGSLLKLDDLIKRDGISETDWLLPLSLTRVNDGVYGLQQDFRIPILIYRKSLLSKAGVTPPRVWDDVCPTASKMTSGSVVGYAVPLGSSGGLGGAQPLTENMFGSMVTESDGNYFSADGRSIEFSRDSFIRTAKTIKGLYACNAAPATSMQFGYTEIHDGLRSGNVAMATFGLFRYRAIETGGAGDDLAWAPPPAYKPDGKMVVYGFQLTINANSTQKEAAWQFAKFMTSPEGQAIAAEGGEVVARASVYADPKLSASVTERQRAWANLVRERGRFVSYPVLSTNFNQVLGDAMQRMILSNGTPEAAYDEVVAKYNEAVRKSVTP